MKVTRYVAFAAGLLVLTGAAHAGGLDDPIVEPEVIVEQTVPSGHDVLVPIMALILFGAALASN